jgi:uracil-DNA glycosylase
MTADDLPAALTQMPQAWRAELRQWSVANEAALVAAVRATSGARPIAPADPFRALRSLAPAQVRVVLFGQAPYPKAGDADGMAFSAPGVTASLRRVFEVMAADQPGWQRPAHGRLVAWAAQGVLLLNTALTVEIGRAGAHLDVGWQALTSELALILAQQPQPPVFMLWGKKAEGFFDAAVPADLAAALQVHRTRHPANDPYRRFMAEGSHFLATADRVDWWALPGVL